MPPGRASTSSSPRSRRRPGFVAAYWVRLDDTHGTSVAVFETEEQARAAAPPADGNRTGRHLDQRRDRRGAGRARRGHAGAEEASPRRGLPWTGVDAPRYRCDGCGNLTRFDVTVSERTKSFYHYTVGGDSSSSRTPRCSPGTSTRSCAAGAATGAAWSRSARTSTPSPAHRRRCRDRAAGGDPEPAPPHPHLHRPSDDAPARRGRRRPRGRPLPRRGDGGRRAGRAPVPLGGLPRMSRPVGGPGRPARRPGRRGPAGRGHPGPGEGGPRGDRGARRRRAGRARRRGGDEHDRVPEYRVAGPPFLVVAAADAVLTESVAWGLDQTLQVCLAALRPA